ncbi:MAG TPA: tRNA threonylcarbamoyladenosine dehydratase [Polyangiaceae bacterium]|nr:tRNA threonylcarbamoyladenosine dehydratase [Polyangiaceae bacterium]
MQGEEPTNAIRPGTERFGIGAGTAEESEYQLHRRFDRIARLIGEPQVERLHHSRVMVIGLGGVGSFAGEALVRSGLGQVLLVDFDRVCVTNSNRQLQAMSGNIGRGKAEVLAERLRLINPQAEVAAVAKFYSTSTSEELLGLAPSCVVDAIDNITAKCHLLAACRARGIPVVSALGAAGRIDPTQIAISDLARTKVCPMGRVLRKILRQQYDFPRSGDLGITAIYSTEVAREPAEVTYDGGLGFRCVCPGGSNDLHSCEKRRVIYGTASWVTGTFGLFCASAAVRLLTDIK